VWVSDAALCCAATHLSEQDLTAASALQNFCLMGKDQFMQGLKEGEELVLFVHGDNVTFKDAVTSAAQLTYDTSPPGAPRTALAFDWACCKDWVPLSRYVEDLARSTNASGKLLALLEDLSTKVSSATPGGGRSCMLPCISLCSGRTSFQH
jgi:esterase/lipase superfamily enzyme